MPEFFRYKPTASSFPRGREDPVHFFTREQLIPPVRRRMNEGDVFETVLQSVLRAGTQLMGPESWPALCNFTSRVRRFEHVRRRRKAFLDVLSAVLPELTADQQLQLFDRNRARQHERRITMLREFTRPDPVRFTIEGKHHLDRALERGKGAIIWTAPFVFQTVVGKRAMAEAGYTLHQVSSNLHGFSHTRYGERVLNRRMVDAENRHLKSRLVFERDEATTVLRKALRCMKNGDPVFFTNNAFVGRNFVQVQLGHRAWLSMPVTPLKLAVSHRIPLIHMSTLERKPFTDYSVELSEDLVGVANGSDTNHAMAQIALSVRDILLGQVRNAPDQFLSWQTVPTRPYISDPAEENATSIQAD